MCSDVHQMVGTPHMKMGSDVHHRVGTPHMKMCSDVHHRVGTPHMKMYSHVLTGVGTPQNFPLMRWDGWWITIQMIMPLRGSILEVGTCQILSLAENPRWSRVWQ